MEPSFLRSPGRDARRCDCNCGDDSPDGALCCPCNCPCDYCHSYGVVYECCQCRPPPPPKSSSCFPSFAKVMIENGKMITMSDLQLGDRLETGMGICQPNLYH